MGGLALRARLTAAKEADDELVAELEGEEGDDEELEVGRDVRHAALVDDTLALLASPLHTASLGGLELGGDVACVTR